MSLFRKVFLRKHTLLIVVHAESREQSLRNVRIAYEQGADGVFLINHRISADDLLECYLSARAMYPNWWIGINFLDLDNKSAIKMAAENSIQGLWLDNAGIQENAEDPCSSIRKLREWQKKYHGEKTLIFGGVAFKYQPKVQSLEKVAGLSALYIDVVTTSGEGTGIAADINKIRLMKQAIGEYPLAIASGITPENISQYLPYVDCFLVATGISDSQSEINPVRLRKLVRAIAAYSE